MMINQTKYHWLMALPALLLAVGCSESILPEGQDTGVAELQVSPQVVLTRGAIDAADASAVGTVLGSIAVYANSKTTNKTTNNYGLYTYSSSKWGNSSTTDKIYLSAEEATIYAHYPAYQPGSNGEFQSGSTALKASGSSGEYTDNSTINISVFPGSTGSVNAKIDFQSTDNSDSQTSTKDKILAASGEVDYMYADQGSTGVKASYKNGDTNKTGQVTLAMKHALAMVSFRVYADHTYKNTGAFTKLVLANKSGGTTILNNGASPTMKIKDGTITVGSSPTAVTYTRDIANYMLPKAASSDASAATTAKDNARKASILVLPESTVDKSTVEATLTIDAQDYKVALPGSDSKWEAGKNYLYTVKLSGSELVISSVTVTQWTTAASSTDLDIK
ncbi:fimbrillin family protein [Bacteroides fragilis]|uniref:fimbrillin family protein n=1 Tax=Bacteroides fragilis TaxID=817 RepID=UPI00254E32CF|nr:fimbrillin family protein [Bacteroides fragilis]MDK7649431.1 fimbrillin family protein [Bacteroides fragilis]MDK7683913.1 fimbrillin family protein [Bacteroides fragilis]